MTTQEKIIKACKEANACTEEFDKLIHAKTHGKFIIVLGQNWEWCCGSIIDEKYRAELAPIDEKWEAELAPVDEKWRAELAPIDEKYFAELAPIDEKYFAERAPIDEKWNAERGEKIYQIFEEEN